MKTFLKFRFRPYLLAVLFASVFGSMFSSLSVISGLTKIGAQTTLSDRLSMITYDLLHFGTLYFIFVAIAFIIAMAVAGIIGKVFPNMRALRFFLAGFAALFVMLYLMKNVFFGIQPIAGARDLSGLLFQGLTGGIAGWLFHRFSDKRLAEQTAEV